MEELSYSLHLGNDKNKSKKARRTAKMNDTNTTSFNNNAIQNHQQLSKVDKHNLRKYDDEKELICIIKGTSSVTSISGTVTVYKKNFWGNYKEVDSEAVKENASSLERYGNLSSDGAGDYKIEFIGTVYAGSSSEPITIDATNSY